MNYSEAQRYIFQANGVIPPEIWLGEYDLGIMDHLIHIGQQSKKQGKNEEMINADFMQDFPLDENTASSSRRRRVRSESK